MYPQWYRYLQMVVKHACSLLFASRSSPLMHVHVLYGRDTAPCMGLPLCQGACRAAVTSVRRGERAWFVF
jgi:hypothetical protein